MEATMRWIALSCLIALGACATDEPERWGRADGRSSTDAQKEQFRRDEAQCQYEQTAMRVPSPLSFSLCMRARGWSRWI
jgi:hypothetical protein